MWLYTVHIKYIILQNIGVHMHYRTRSYTQRHRLAGKALAVGSKRAAINLCWSFSYCCLHLHPLSLSVSLLTLSQRGYGGQSITVLMV